MIEDIWKKMSADPMAEGYSFKKIGLPSPNKETMSTCRRLCAQNLCGQYGVTWACPPGTGTEEECLGTIKKFSKAAVIIREFDNIDVKDEELVEALAEDHQEVCRRFGNLLREEGYSAVPLSDGGCKYCEECSYPDESCRFPDQMVPSISSFGIIMDEYMKSQNIDFEFRKDGMTLYGLMLYNEP
jgi:predicted metal-binding protein